MVCGIEVKEAGGDYEAMMQLAIWSAAGLEKVKRLGRIQSNDLPPFIGWTSVGNEWKAHLSWMNSSGHLTMGPLRPINYDTGSLYGIFVLFQLISRSCSYLTLEYLPWLLREVLGPLALP